MKNEKYKQKEIYSRIDDLVLSVLLLIRDIPKDLIVLEICKQLIRSITSIGANAREAQAAQTKKEFIHCLSISKKESKESWYWLSLLVKLNLKMKERLGELVKECDEITAILSSIIKTARLNS